MGRVASGSVYVASVDDQGKVGLYRLEIGSLPGTGKLRMSGAIDGTVRESIQRSFAYVQGHKVDMGISQAMDTTDLHLEAIDLLTEARGDQAQPAKPQSLECPRCGCRHLYCVDTRSSPRQMTRMRQCRHGGRGLVTHEEIAGCAPTFREGSR